MNWKPSGKELPPDFLGDLQPERVLVDFEGPRSYLARDGQEELLFVHQCGESEDFWRYAVVPFTDELTQSLVSGKTSLSSALAQPRLWIVDIDSEGDVVSCTSSKLDDIPNEHRPYPGATLLPQHEPLLSLRAVGPGVTLGMASLAVLRDQLDSARRGLRLLAEAATEVYAVKGPPTKETRHYYDLPAVLAAGSVQVNVFPMQDSQGKLFDWEADETWNKMAELLAWGLSQVSENAPPLSESNEAPPLEQQEAVINAVYALAPPARGLVRETELSGKLLPNNRPVVRMDRTVRRRLNTQLSLIDEGSPDVTVFNHQGFITELDVEEGTCLLRNEIGETIKKLAFGYQSEIADATLFEDVKDAFDSLEKVSIQAIDFAKHKVAMLISVEPIAIHDLHEEQKANGKEENSTEESG